MSFYLLFIWTIFFVVGTSEYVTWFTFTKDKESLSRCIEDNLLKDNSWEKNIEVAKVTADLVAKRIHGKIKTQITLGNSVRNFFYQIRNNDIYIISWTVTITLLNNCKQF